MIKDDTRSFFIDSKNEYGSIIPERECLVWQLMTNNRIWKCRYMTIGDEDHQISFFWKLCFYLRYKFKPCKCERCKY